MPSTAPSPHRTRHPRRRRVHSSRRCRRASTRSATHHSDGSLANAPYLYGEEIFDYDALDNVRRAAIYPLGGGSYLLDYRFVYDANQRLDRINDAIGTLLWDYSHNALGETTWRSGAGNTWNYAWSAAGRMTQGGNESYVYDAHGHRTRASRSGTGSTRYQVHNRSGKLLYVEDSRDDQRIDYLHLGNKLIAQRSRPLYGSTATVTYHHTDHLGSASVETNASGTQTQRTLRTPYGSPYDGTYREGPGFAGHVTDTATNLTYMQQRYYDPVAMRFISVDPVDVSAMNGSNFNRYWYGNNNPYRFTDPDGRAGKPIAWLVKLSANQMRKVARITQEQAVRARQAEQNVVADRRQVASQIETAAHGRNGQLKHPAHELKGDGGKGLPHYQTDDVQGHSFWGKISVAAALVADGLDNAAQAAEIADPTNWLTSGSGGDLVNHEMTWFGAYRQIDPNGPTYSEALNIRSEARQSSSGPSGSSLKSEKVMCTGSRIARDSC